MAKDKNDTQTTDAFKRRPGRPKSDSALSNAERQRLYRQRHAKPDLSIQLADLQWRFDSHVNTARAEVQYLQRQLEIYSRKMDLCRSERSAAFRVVYVYRERLEQAGLSTDY